MGHKPQAIMPSILWPICSGLFSMSLIIDVSLILTPESGLYTCCRPDSGHSQVRHGPGPHTQNFCSYIPDSANIRAECTEVHAFQTILFCHDFWLRLYFRFCKGFFIFQTDAPSCDMRCAAVLATVRTEYGMQYKAHC